MMTMCYLMTQQKRFSRRLDQVAQTFSSFLIAQVG